MSKEYAPSSVISSSKTYSSEFARCFPQQGLCINSYPHPNSSSSSINPKFQASQHFLDALQAIWLERGKIGLSDTRINIVPRETHCSLPGPFLKSMGSTAVISTPQRGWGGEELLVWLFSSSISGETSSWVHFGFGTPFYTIKTSGRRLLGLLLFPS